MTDWSKVRGSVKPLEIDTTSSPSTVYLRRNIEEVEVEDQQSGETIKEWQYDEMTLSHSEWDKMQSIYPIIKSSMDDTSALEVRTSQAEDAILELSGAIYS